MSVVVVGDSLVLSFGALDGIRVLGLTLGTAVLLVLAALVGTGVVLGGWAFASAGRRVRSLDEGDGLGSPQT